MSRIDPVQAMLLALTLKARGFTSTAEVPLKVWLDLHFLMVPGEKLLKKIDECLAMAADNQRTI